jgi:DNA-binding LacI/PurR family transcriptional regulator
MKRYLYLVISVVLFAGCTAEREQKTVHVAVLLSGWDRSATNQYVQAMDLSANVFGTEVTWRAAGLDPVLQRRQLDTLLALQPDVVVFEPADPHTAGESISRIERAGVPVIGFNRPVLHRPYDLFITPDYKSIAREMADTVREHLGREGGSVLFVHDAETGIQDSLMLRTFLNALDGFVDIRIDVEELLPEGNGPTGGYRIPDPEALVSSADIIVCSHTGLTAVLTDALSAYRTARPNGTVPLLIGIGDEIAIAESGEIRLILFDLLSYDTGKRVLEIAAQYARGGYRHHTGPVYRSSEYMFPVVYTPYRVARISTTTDTR